MAELHAQGEKLPFAIEIIAFGDEEGVRFPVTLTGTRAVAGTLDPAALDVEDENRISVREALQVFGCNPFDIPKIPRSRDNILGYVEVHIEQGPLLESEKLPVGIVTAISGAKGAVQRRGDRHRGPCRNGADGGCASDALNGSGGDGAGCA